MEQKGKYIPGVCNIGIKERQDRLRMGVAGIMLASGWTFLGYVWVFPIFLKFFVFIPTFLGILGSLQYWFRFCVYHAFKEEQNIDDEAIPVLVSDDKAVDLDKQKAVFLTLISLLFSFLYTLLVFFLF